METTLLLSNVHVGKNTSFTFLLLVFVFLCCCLSFVLEFLLISWFHTSSSSLISNFGAFVFLGFFTKNKKENSKSKLLILLREENWIFSFKRFIRQLGLFLQGCDKGVVGGPPSLIFYFIPFLLFFFYRLCLLNENII